MRSTLGAIGTVVIVMSLAAAGVPLLGGASQQAGTGALALNQNGSSWNAEYGSVQTFDSVNKTGPVAYVDFNSCTNVTLYGEGRYQTVKVNLDGGRTDVFNLGNDTAGQYTPHSGKVLSVSLWLERFDQIESGHEPVVVFEAPCSESTGDGGSGGGDDGTGTDSDGDGLTDAEEQERGTDPADEDTDGDLYWDGDEVNSGTNPTDPADHPIRDADGDGFINTEEIGAGTDPNDSGSYPASGTSPDGDSLTDSEEQQYGTDPADVDTDGDLYWDDDEVNSGTDPTDPADHPIRDSDGDGYINTEEIGAGTDPNDPSSTP